MKQSISTCRLGVIALLSAGAAFCASPPRVNTPSLGHFLDPGSHRIRALAGIPGAALAKPALDGCPEIEQGALSSEREYALGSTPDSLVLIRLDAAGCTIEPLPFPPADRIVISPSGSVAAVYRAAGNAIDVIAGLPAAPALKREFSLNAAGELRSIAVGDDGAFVLAAGEDDGGSPWLATEEGVSRLPVSGSVLAMAARPLRQEAAILTTDGITTAADLTGSPRYQLVMDNTMLAGAQSLAFSAGGNRLVVVSASGAILVTDEAAAAPIVLSCDCRPAGLQRLNGNAFALTGAPEILRVLDAGRPLPRVVFVPEAIASPF